MKFYRAAAAAMLAAVSFGAAARTRSPKPNLRVCTSSLGTKAD